jgi:hypothetical protein
MAAVPDDTQVGRIDRLIVSPGTREVTGVVEVGRPEDEPGARPEAPVHAAAPMGPQTRADPQAVVLP